MAQHLKKHKVTGIDYTDNGELPYVRSETMRAAGASGCARAGALRGRSSLRESFFCTRSMRPVRSSASARPAPPRRQPLWRLQPDGALCVGQEDFKGAGVGARRARHDGQGGDAAPGGAAGGLTRLLGGRGLGGGRREGLQAAAGEEGGAT